jgi:hemerythrin
MQSGYRMDWKDSYSVGIEEIDSQHKELLRLFRTITESVSQNSWSEVHFQIVELNNFAKFHFQFEEALMRFFGYPDAARHAISHQAFYTRLDEIMRSSIITTVQDEMVRFLFNWMTQHILVSDRGYSRHILDRAPSIRIAQPAAS